MIDVCMHVLYHKVCVLYFILTSWVSLQVSIETTVDSPSLGKPVGVCAQFFGMGVVCRNHCRLHA